MRSFTLIELLIVTGIISTLIVFGFGYYSNYLKSSRDAKRKVDLDNIRIALEQFKSNYSCSCYPVTLGALVNNNYLKSIPNDPIDIKYDYKYLKLPSSCTNTNMNYCNNYVLGAYFEKNPPDNCTDYPDLFCGSGNPCNYCVGPNGKL